MDDQQSGEWAQRLKENREQHYGHREAITAVLDHAHGAVFVVFGKCNDSTKIFGIYDSQAMAEDAKKLLRSAGSEYDVNYVRIERNKAMPTELQP